jgi:hypothetical protein
MLAKTTIALAVIAGTASAALAAPGRDWTRFDPADRASCLLSTGPTGTYTDLLDCLEARRDARQLREKPSTSGKGNPD